MSVGTGGTFMADAARIGMTSDDIRHFVDNLRRLEGNKGWFAHTFNNKPYMVQYVNDGSDTTLLAIMPRP
ncbi:MAG TPA: hypothetical protein VMS64_11575 [Candidatus Methylomirabilis sp.]|nr:hypothetical protein [Candidatus Methylomirabilis sp.]